MFYVDLRLISQGTKIYNLENSLKTLAEKYRIKKL